MKGTKQIISVSLKVYNLHTCFKYTCVIEYIKAHIFCKLQVMIIFPETVGFESVVWIPIGRLSLEIIQRVRVPSLPKVLSPKNLPF